MNSFAFVIHPLDPKRDVARKYPLLARILPTPLIHFFSRFWPPVYISHITGVRSKATGEEIEGWLIACPFTARQMLRLPHQTVYRKIVQTGRMAQKLGANLLGLGAFTSAIGDGGITVAQQLDIPVTTGHSLTVAIAGEALKQAALNRGFQLESVTAAVIGATGSIGSACAELIAPLVGELILIGRREFRLAKVEAQVRKAGARQVRTSTRLKDTREADLVLSATNTARPIIQPEHLKRGSVVYDVALPPDVSPRVAQERDDVLIIAGGMVSVPGDVDFGFNFGLPPGAAYACMAETMILTLEERYENYSLGKQVQVERVREIARLAHKHGFRLRI
ncbi:MAG: shikimate dehydrogenase [Chloroflexi bacterium]|nr:MAG: shikimate dehydrogenase [Chloroflexota bacterium]